MKDRSVFDLIISWREYQIKTVFIPVQLLNNLENEFNLNCHTLKPFWEPKEYTVICNNVLLDGIVTMQSFRASVFLDYLPDAYTIRLWSLG